ncbi:Protein CBG27572 [Caenorhabditis briggsae]|uniref:Protein CBG27572 n=1 Tax=Caenorhabditis briggsae TaxID=6238 RepID=B6IKN5_CAEBR|nr:Protein CBG27572 [Caenorhabditis briggsae]CAS00465.1 Protein CBG27572 [Caenorhabditis briggsae]
MPKTQHKQENFISLFLKFCSKIYPLENSN